MRISGLALALFCTANAAGLSSVARGQAGPADTWKPDAKAAEQLGEPIEFEGYTLRPPKGYQMERGNPPQGAKASGWAAPPRADGTRPSFTMLILSPAPAGAELGRVADRMAAGIKRRRTNWRQEEPERGKIGGLDFVRIRWSGTDAALRRDMKGVLYVTLDGGALIQLATQDVTPAAEEALPVGEAAILSLRKK